MRSLLIKGLAEHMSALPEAQARTLAHDLTSLVSAHVGKLPLVQGRDPSFLSRLPCFPRETWNVHTLSVPWEAFQAAHGGARLVAPSYVKALCSAPVQLDSILAEQAIQSGLWGGSLLAALGNLMAGARHDLAIISPYWRLDGVRSLLSTAGRASYAGLQVRVFSPGAPRMKPEDLEALSFLIDKLRNSGARVQRLAPRLVEGMAPFVHAKLIVADSNRAYVGSANFTSSGLNYGLEAGVIVEGDIASAFALWVNAVEAACDTW